MNVYIKLTFGILGIILLLSFVFGVEFFFLAIIGSIIIGIPFFSMFTPQEVCSSIKQFLGFAMGMIWILYGLAIGILPILGIVWLIRHL